MKTKTLNTPLSNAQVEILRMFSYKMENDDIFITKTTVY
jgi:hypothetical protein